MSSSSIVVEDQSKLLDEVLNVVKVQAHLMKKCLENNKLMEGLKHCSNMLAELRTSALTPKNYYELYMSIFDAMRHVTAFLKEAHVSNRHHLAELYELVQYAGNILPRLYLMITVGSVYMSIPDAPVREIMRDMMEMTRGVQHPIRGLFLRHYLSSMTRDHLPLGESTGPEGNIFESTSFILTNFTEMNKLWVRLQHQGLSRDREKREDERKELRILVGTNLVRLSQLEGVDIKIYQKDILPGVLDQVVSCRDVIAQEYLMEVITQVFPDEFHLGTLQPFLSATAELHPKVNVKQIIISLIDRLAAFATRETENEEGDDIEKQRETKIQRIADERKRKLQGLEETAADGIEEETDDETKNIEALNVRDNVEKEDRENVNMIRGIPGDVELFVVFWNQVVELVKARPDLSLLDLTALLVSLLKLSLSCYPEKFEYADQILAYTKDKVIEFSDSPELHSKAVEANLLSLLLAPVQHYGSALHLLALANYQPLLSVQPYDICQTVSCSIVNSILHKETIIGVPEDLHGVLDLCTVLLRDQKDTPNASQSQYGRKKRNTPLSYEEDENQGLLAKLVHFFQSKSEDTQFLLLSAARKQFGDDGDRIRYTFPPLIISAAKLARRYKVYEEKDEIWEKKTSTLYRFIHQSITTLYEKCDECSETCLNLFLLAGQSANECGFEEIAYEFFTEAFSIYEESISESRAQFQAIACIIGSLQRTRVLSFEKYDRLITKAAMHSAKLLKKPDQCRAIYLSSHLWWSSDEKTDLFRDGKRTLECLQRALKIADSCMDSITNVQLFVEILNRYIYYFEKENDAVTVKYLNGLIDLINTNLGNMDDPDQHPPTSNSSSLVIHKGSISEYVRRHFRSTLLHLQSRKEQATNTDASNSKYSDLELGDF